MPLSAGKYNTDITRDAHERARRRARGGRREGRLRPGGVRRRTGGCSSAPSARATTSSRCRSTRTTGCGCSCTPGRAASATRSPSTTSRSPSGSASGGSSTCPTATWPTSSRAPPSSGPTSRELRWAQQFALLNREEMMDRVVACFEGWIGDPVEPRARRSTATTTTPTRSTTSARTCGCPARARSTPREGSRGLIPGSMGTRVLRRRRQGQPARTQLVPARRRPRSTPGRAARKTFTHDDLRAAMGDIEYRDTDAFIDEIPGGVQGHRRR